MLSLKQTLFQNGLWSGRLQSSTPLDAPNLRASLDGVLDLDLRVIATPGMSLTWDVSLRLPEACLSEGTHLVLVEEATTETPLYRLPIVAGIAATEDIRAEVHSLRAELNQLRAAFRAEMRRSKSP